MKDAEWGIITSVLLVHPAMCKYLQEAFDASETPIKTNTCDSDSSMFSQGFLLN